MVLFLRDYPVKIYRQRVIDSFIVDFYCASAKLVIEIDGSQHYTENGLAYDEERSAILQGKYGLQVLRFTNHDIDVSFSAVCQQIHIEIDRNINRPQPQQERGTPNGKNDDQIL